MPGRLLATCVATLLACQTATLRADAPTTLDALLALPLSPGVEVLLLPHATEARVQQRWRQALSDQDPDRRAAAARMIGITGLRTAIGSVRAAVTNEHDVVARAEMLQALIVIGSEVTDRVVITHIGQLPGSAARRVVRTLATLRPANLTTFVAEGGVLAVSRDQASERAADLHARLLRVSPTEAVRLEAVPDRLAATTLQGVLHLAHSTARRVSTPMLIAGLRTDAHTAGEVLAYLPAVHGRPRDVDATLRTAYATWRNQQPMPEDAHHELLLAMADRWLGRDREAALSIDRIDAATLLALELPTKAFAVLSRDERRALARRLELSDRDAKELEGIGFAGGARESAWEANPSAVLLTDLPGVVLADLVRLTGCVGKAFESDRALTVSYRPDGRPESIVVGGLPLDGPCDRLSQLVARASYGDPTLPRDEPGRALLRLLPEFISCQRDRDAEWRQPSPAPTPASGPSFTPLRKIKDQKPTYPLAAQQRRVQGTVVIETLVTLTGCVAEARVIESIPDLDLSALQAVAAWQYAPATLGTAPVAVPMTMTINFEMAR